MSLLVGPPREGPTTALLLGERKAGVESLKESLLEPQLALHDRRGRAALDAYTEALSNLLVGMTS